MNGTGKKCYPGQQAELVRCCPQTDIVTTSNAEEPKYLDDPDGTYYGCGTTPYFV